MPTERPAPAEPPRTADGDGFRFRAGRPSLDLCSTVLWRHVAPVEQLERPEDLSRWLVGAGLWTGASAVSESDLRAARSLREALYGLFLARIHGRPLAAGVPEGTADGIAVVNRAAARPDPAPQLSADGELRLLTGDQASASLSAVARDGIDLLTGSLAGRLRECAADDCAFLFVDTSQPGRRRWCAHSRCGNRQNVRDHRARQRRGGERT
ncbi:CGNR zinc finger domain-containing protein [Streptomyces winkii]|uniref:CGNR zinc finger domain-containing protein n=1 Tax=Streptomyces winkii TaxID=3051178 RepID=UPI0028D4E19E|nr:ABATE domain-containing protein [Streptomyces sp. DSM 40971]